jgi:4-amino-4-deoxy-L-arabinose transferase-like glycosyltransferase
MNQTAATGGPNSSILRRSAVIAAAIAPVVILVVAFGLRAAFLGDRQLFRDEAASWLLSGYPLGPLVEHNRLEAYPPLYPVLLKAFMRVFGDGEVALRMPSVLAGVATVGAVWAWARRAQGRFVAIVAMAFLAVSAIAVNDARQARMYSLETAFSTIAWWLTWQLVSIDWPAGPQLDKRTLALAAALAGAVAGELWTLALGVPMAALQGGFVLVALVAAIRLRKGGPPGWRRLPAAVPRGPGLAVAAYALAGLTFVPWLPTLLSINGNGQPFWTGKPHLDAFVQTYAQIVGTGGTVDGTLTFRTIGIVLALAGLVGLARVSVRRRRTGTAAVGAPADSPTEAAATAQADPWPARLFGLALVMGIALVPLVWVYSQSRPIFDARYMGATAPLLCLLMAAGLPPLAGWLRNRAIPFALALVLVVSMASGAIQLDAQLNSNSAIDPGQEAVARLESIVRPGDVILANSPLTYFSLDYYLTRSGGEGRFGVRLYDWYGPGQPFYFGTALISPDRVIVDKTVAATGWAAAFPTLAPGGTIWLVSISNGNRNDIGFAPLSKGQLVQLSKTLVPGAGGMSSNLAQIRELKLPAK